jgi:hypothetical protein
MPAALALQLAYRNARLRAWRALGVPVRGGWLHWEGGWAFLAGCDCGVLLLPQLLEAGDSPAALEQKAGAPCDHLAPLLGEEPPALLGLTRLELLAGDLSW